MTQNNNTTTIEMIKGRNNTRSRKSWLMALTLVAVIALPALSQEQETQKTDSLIVNVGSSKIIFLVNNKEDLKKLKEYDLNAIVEKLSLRLEEQDSANNEMVVADTTIVSITIVFTIPETLLITSYHLRIN
ncbi:MAG: hypothetical protein AAFN93_04710, partial [Bacteroidota bacterium]